MQGMTPEQLVRLSGSFGRRAAWSALLTPFGGFVLYHVRHSVDRMREALPVVTLTRPGRCIPLGIESSYNAAQALRVPRSAVTEK